MKIFIVASKYNYKHIPAMAQKLQAAGHVIIFPNNFDDPMMELRVKAASAREHRILKADLFKKQIAKVASADAMLVVNKTKGRAKNYIGGATFLEMYEAWKMGKKIYLLNPIPEGILADEIAGFDPKVINNDLGLIK